MGSRILLALAAWCGSLFAQAGSFTYPPQMDGSRVEVYKTIAGVKLNAYIFEPSGHRPSDRRAAIVFFFGGGWQNGSPKQFEQQSRYLASRGMVAITADYRVGSRHAVKAVECVRDAKSAIRWVRQNAARLGVDPSKIVAAGGSAGGHIAACTGVIDGLDEPAEDASISSRPNAMVLFNPVVAFPAAERFAERLGIDAEAISPYHHVRKGAPPAIIFHGKDDKTVPYKSVELFAAQMTKAGNRCEVAGFEGAGHGFFNYGRGGNKAYAEAVRGMDEFLTSLGYLPPKP